MTIWKRERAHFNYYITNERKKPHIYVEALGTPSASTEKILKVQKCMFSYIEWAGTCKHPKAIEKESYGIIKGSWIYYKNGKKSLNGKYIHIIKEFERAPRGTAALFKQIEKDL